MNKILVVGTGGTIGCVKDENNIHLDTPLKILDLVSYDDIEFDCATPFNILSENANLSHWEMLYNFISTIDFEKYKGAIILNGSDSLSFTSSFIANAFYNKPIVIIASDKPLEDKTANGLDNFKRAVEYIINGIDRVYVSYNKIYPAETKKAIDNPSFKMKNGLIISPYVGIDYSNYNIDNVDFVLHSMYHSATAPENVNAFIELCKSKSIPFYFVTENDEALYISSSKFENIIFNSSIESAWARIILSNFVE